MIDNMYLAQEQELIALLKHCAAQNEPLCVLEEAVLSSDEAQGILVKIKQRHHFSRKEKHALIHAGFNIEKIFPDLV